VPGIVCIFFSPTYKRIGDYAAGTLVIVERGAAPFGARRKTRALSPTARELFPQIKNLDRLTEDEYRLVRRFTARRDEIDAAVQSVLAQRIAVPLMQKLEMRLPALPPHRYADLLEALERRYAEEHGIL